MSLFPIFVKLQGRLVVVVGGGEIAAGKIAGMLRAGARVRVIAPEVHVAFAEPIRSRKIEWLPRKFAAGDLDGATLVIAGTSAPGVNASVFREAEARGILCNAVDDMPGTRTTVWARVRTVAGMAGRGARASACG